MKRRFIVLVSVLCVAGAGFVKYNNVIESSAKYFDASGRWIGPNQGPWNIPPNRIEAEKPEIKEIQDDSAVEVVEEYGDIYIKDEKPPKKKNIIKKIKTLQSLKKTKDKSGKRK